ncbi:MAG TPA: Rieske 2Fe-2S domain-containing protein [Nitriliruptorales bacterium]
MSDTTNHRRLPELPKVERRTFLRYGLAGGTLAGLATFGAASLAFLWPGLGEGFGAEIEITDFNARDLFAKISDEKAPFAYPAGRMYVIRWEPGRSGAMDAYGEQHQAVLGPSEGLMALYHKCVHLGCRVPWCQTSQWFECPCHGSKYNRWGEWVDGPAPRGLDRFPSSINEAGNLVIDTGAIVTGPSRTGNVLQQEAEGPNCVSL